jgi:transposase InsO family protein
MIPQLMRNFQEMISVNLTETADIAVICEASRFKSNWFLPLTAELSRPRARYAPAYSFSGHSRFLGRQTKDSPPPNRG